MTRFDRVNFLTMLIRTNSFLLVGSIILMLSSCNSQSILETQENNSDLKFSTLATTWDEGMPLGNGTVGELVWMRDSSLRFSLDRTDLWDLRPMDSLKGPSFTFEWVKQHIRNKDYAPVQQKLDVPYDRESAPSKIPGAALEFSLKKIGAPVNVRLYINNALCQADWEDGTRLQTFIQADRPVGWFSFTNLNADMLPMLIMPDYAGATEKGGHTLASLGYEQGSLQNDDNQISYHQNGYGGFYYDVVVRWEQHENTLTGVWSITSSLSGQNAEELAKEALDEGIRKAYERHLEYWNRYWAQSSISLPDSLLQKQYDNEMYKFGSASREDSYPISLQAVWTADDGQLPPWKGDYHHDLNTELSYWPAYTGNHLKEGLGFLNTLWNQRDAYKAYTRQYFQKDGMNVPGVCTLLGEPMGGWIQYSMSQTMGAWLAHHFYQHYQYSKDSVFLKDRAYPFIKDVATYMEQQSFVDDKGVRRLEFSSSPEMFDNSLQAWFSETSNFDLALMRFIFKAASELAGDLNLADEQEHWAFVGAQLPDWSLAPDSSLNIAPGIPYQFSHRHFSNALGIHPLGLIDWSQGKESQKIIDATLARLKEYGPDWWTGYSYSWYGCLLARAFRGNDAAEALRTFAECFCLKNTFHVNGDQTKSGKSKFTYRPFTLEGNFAFAAGIQEMLLQSHTGVIRVFPAIPDEWKNVSFKDLRAVGAFLVSAKRENGHVTEMKIYSEKGGTLRVINPETGEEKEYSTKPGETVEII